MNLSNTTADSTASDAGPESGQAVRQLNSLLRGEISAAETYRMAIDKFADSSSATHLTPVLRQVQEDHGRAALELRRRIQELGGEASDSSGAWGAWAQTVQGAANLLGDAAALKTLKEGEEHGLKDYADALTDLDPRSAGLVRAELIPVQQQHIALLDRLLTSVGRA